MPSPFENIQVSRGTEEILHRYQTMVSHWGKAINLVADSRETEVWTRHILDSYQLVPQLLESDSNIIDFGSGAGFPGIVLAIAAPEKQVTLVESDRRKTVFLGEVQRTLGLKNLVVLNRRIEEISQISADLITSRACASLKNLVEYSLPFRHNSTRCLFLKGRNWKTELDEALHHYRFEWRAIDSQTEPGAAILELRNIESK